LTIRGMRLAHLAPALIILLAPGLAWAAASQRDVAVSTEKGLIVTANRRVIYVLDAASMEVKRRIWNDGIVQRLSFSRDGSRLAITDDTGRLRILDSATWEPVKEVRDIGAAAFAPAADVLLVRERKNRLLVLRSMTTGEELGRAALAEDTWPVALVLSPDGKRAMAISGALVGKEKSLPYAEWPRDFKDQVERDTFAQKNDGRHSHVVLYSWPDGKVLSEADVWYCLPMKSLPYWRDDEVVVPETGNAWAAISCKGDVRLLEWPGWYCDGLGWSPSGDCIFISRIGGYAFLRRGDKPVKVELKDGQKLPGGLGLEQETFLGFGFGSDGVVFGVTSDSRIARIDKSGKLVEIKPFF